MWPIVLIEIAINLSQGGGAEPPCKPAVPVEASACTGVAIPTKPGEPRSVPRATSAARQ